jgi:hypothetical protein
MLELLTNHGGKTVNASAKVHGLRHHQDLHAGRSRNHVAAFTVRNTSHSHAGSTPRAARTTAPPISIVIAALSPADAPAHSIAAKLRDDRNEQQHLVGRQAQQARPRRLARGKQVLRRDVVPARHIQHDRPWPRRTLPRSVP